MDDFERFTGKPRRHYERYEKLARQLGEAGYVSASNKLGTRKRDGRGRRPPEAGLPVPAISPKGPLPLQGGAEAPLDFDA